MIRTRLINEGLKEYDEDGWRKYYTGFSSNRSTYELKIPLHSLLIDFRQVHDRLDKASLHKAITCLQIPAKLIRLTEMTKRVKKT